MKSISIIVICHNDIDGLINIVKCINSQTYINCLVDIYYSDMNDTDIFNITDDIKYPIRVIRRENHNDWGHDKRKHGILNAQGDFVTCWNSDDYYDKNFISMMMEHNDNDIIYCNWFNGHDKWNCEFTMGSSTAGNYIVNSNIAKNIEYKTDKYESDGIFINDLSSLTNKVYKVSDYIYIHNYDNTYKYWED